MSHDSAALSTLTEEAVRERRLKPLFQTWTPERLSRECLLTPADLVLIRRRLGATNRLGCALHLVVLRLVHRALPSLAVVPDAIIHFVALQLELDPIVVADYPQRAQTQDDHGKLLRDYLGLRLYTAEDRPALHAHLIQRALHRDDPLILLEEAEEWLRRHSILYPALSTLVRLIGDAGRRADEQVHTTILSQLTEEQRTEIRSLVETPHDRRSTRFAWLKEAARTASAKSLKELIAKRATILATQAHTVDLSPLNRNRARQLADMGRKYGAATMRRFDDEKQCAILVCLLHDLQESVTDDLVEMVDQLIGKLFGDAEDERNDLMTQQGKALNRHFRRFRTVSCVLLDPAVADGDVRTAAFAQVPAVDLQVSVTASAPLVQPDDYNIFAFLTKRYAHLRTFLPAVLAAVSFTGPPAARPLLDAIQFLDHLDRTRKRWKRLPAETPTAFIPERWHPVIWDADGRINHRMWILCLAEQLRNALRSSDLLVPGSRQHRDWRSYLHADAAWIRRRPSWFGDNWHGAPHPHAYVAHVNATFDATVARVTAGWADNRFARIEDGRLVLSKDTARTVPASAKALREEVQRLVPRIPLPDLLLEVNQWVGFRPLFTHPHAPSSGAWASRAANLDATIFAAIMALGCNMTLSAMAASADLPYHHLVHTADWYVREEGIRQSIIRLVNYHQRLPLASSFGPGTAAMSDGVRFGVSARSLYARPNPRLPVRRSGITLYDMISDQGSQPYIDVIRCDIREAAAALDAALHHETELPLHEHMTDTHGYTDLICGLFELESLIFSPRIRDLPSQVLYPLALHHKQGPLGALFRGPTIQPARIITAWDEMHRIAASLKDGTVTAKLLVSKLEGLKRQSGGHRGILELGRVFKTLAALTFISDESYRRRIHRTLNRGELLHSLARELFFGQHGLFREHDLESQLNRATCLSLIINAIIVWNTRYMMKALDHLRATGYPLSEDDLAYLTPILWEHINLQGSYRFMAPQRQQDDTWRPLRRA